MGLEVIEFIIRIEQTFGIALEDSEVEQVQSIADLERLLIRKLGAEQRSSSGVYEAIIRVLIEEFDRELSSLSRHASFAHDLDFT